LSHTLEHIYEPVSLLKTIEKFLAEDGTVVVSVPNIKAQIDECFLNALHFEHTYYIDHEYIRIMAQNAGLRVSEIFDFSKYNSLYALKRGDTESLGSHPEKQAASESFMRFTQKLQEDVREINISAAGKQCYIFGAHVFTQYLINFGLDTANIRAVLDNDPAKIGKRLYGTNLPIQSPEALKEDSSPTVILRVSQYRNEIEEQLKSINKSTVLI